MALGYSYAPYFKNALKTVPLIMASRPTGSGRQYRTRQPSYTGVLTTDRKRKARSRSLKSIISGMKEAKHYTVDNNTALVHNTIVCMSPTQGITQGTGIANRDGDSVRLEALKIKGNFQSDATAGAYTYRILVGYSGEEINTANIASQFVSGLGTSHVFFPATANNYTSNGIVNAKAFTVLYDQTFDINSQIASTRDVVSMSHTVQLGTDFPYEASASVMGKFKNLFVILISDVALGISGTTPCGNALMSFDLIFKDK